MVVGSCYYYYLGWWLLLLGAGGYYYYLVAGELISGREAAAIPSHWLTKPSPAPHTFVNRILTSRTRLSYIHPASLTHNYVLSYPALFHVFLLQVPTQPCCTGSFSQRACTVARSGCSATMCRTSSSTTSVWSAPTSTTGRTATSSASPATTTSGTTRVGSRARRFACQAGRRGTQRHATTTA